MGWIFGVIAFLAGLYFFFKSNQDWLVGIIIALIVFLILKKIFGRKKQKVVYVNR
jgi:cytosine/uracil/thiamine/allantoin permease